MEKDQEKKNFFHSNPEKHALNRFMMQRVIANEKLLNLPALEKETVGDVFTRWHKLHPEDEPMIRKFLRSKQSYEQQQQQQQQVIVPTTLEEKSEAMGLPLVAIIPSPHETKTFQYANQAELPQDQDTEDEEEEKKEIPENRPLALNYIFENSNIEPLQPLTIPPKETTAIVRSPTPMQSTSTSTSFRAANPPPHQDRSGSGSSPMESKYSPPSSAASASLPVASNPSLEAHFPSIHQASSNAPVSKGPLLITPTVSPPSNLSSVEDVKKSSPGPLVTAPLPPPPVSSSSIDLSTEKIQKMMQEILCQGMQDMLPSLKEAVSLEVRSGIMQLEERMARLELETEDVLGKVTKSRGLHRDQLEEKEEEEKEHQRPHQDIEIQASHHDPSETNSPRKVPKEVEPSEHSKRGRDTRDTRDTTPSVDSKRKSQPQHKRQESRREKEYACQHCGKEIYISKKWKEKEEDFDPYEEDKHREWNIRLKKYEIEGFPLPKDFSLEKARLFDKAVLRERYEAEQTERQFIEEREELLIQLGYGFEYLAKTVGIGSEALGGFGKSLDKFVTKKRGLRFILKRMFNEERKHSFMSPRYSLISPIIGILLKTMTKNETPHVAVALGKGVKQVRKMMQGGAEGKRSKTKFSRGLHNLGFEMLQNIIMPNGENSDEDESEEEERFAEEEEEKKERLDRVQQYRDKLRRSGVQPAQDHNQVLEDPQDFLLQSRQNVRAHFPLTVKGKQLLEHPEDAEMDRDLLGQSQDDEQEFDMKQIDEEELEIIDRQEEKRQNKTPVTKRKVPKPETYDEKIQRKLKQQSPPLVAQPIRKTFAFRKPSKGEVPRIEASGNLPIRDLFGSMLSPDGLVQGLMKGLEGSEKHHQLIEQQNKELTETLKNNYIISDSKQS
jgi:hypothetical protein